MARKAVLKNLLILSIAGLINAIGVTIFLAPVKLYDSGISGTSILLSQITPESFSLSLFFADTEYTALFVRAEKAGDYFYSLRDFCGSLLFYGRVADNRYSPC